MIDSINIYEKKVEIKTDLIYKAIEIGFTGQLYIKKLLPADYLIKKGNGKLLIIKFSRNDELLKELFEYDGSCNITYAVLVDKDYVSHKLAVVQNARTTWNSLGKKPNGENFTWGNLTTDFDLMTAGIRNDIRKRTVYVDDGTGTNTKIKREENYYPDINSKRDRNLKVLGNLNAKGRELQLKGEKAPYLGKYHIHLDIMKPMTGEMPHESSQELQYISQKKTKSIVSKTLRRGY